MIGPRARLSTLALLRVFTYLAAGIAVIVASEATTVAMVGVIATVVSLVCYALDRAKPIPAIAVWEAAYLVLVGWDALGKFDVAVALVGQRAAESAVLLLMLAEFCVVLGHAALHYGWSDAWQESMSRVVSAARPTICPRRSRSFLFAATGVFLAVSLPTAIQTATTGRISEAASDPLSKGFLEPILGGLGSATGGALPALIAYHVLVIKRGTFSRALALSSPVFLIQFATGDRYPLLISVSGLAVVAFLQANAAGHRVRKSQVALLMLAVVVAGGLMLQFRTQGLLGSSNARQQTSGVELIPSEGVTVTVAEAIDYFGTHPHRYGYSSAAVTVFWLPRSVWAGKPTLFGYWFPREYGLSGFDAGHSVAGSFVADWYADFGFIGALVVAMLFGCLFGIGDRFLASRIVREGPIVATIAPLYGAIAFAVRSLDTALIAVAGIVMVGYLYRRTTEVETPSRASATSVSVRAPMSGGPVQ